MSFLETRVDLPVSQRVLYTLFTLTFLVFPFYYQDNLGGEGMSLPFNAVIWFGVLATIGTAVFQIIRTGEWIKTRYLGVLSLFPIGIVASGFISGMERPGEWLVRLGVIVGGMLFWWALLQFRLKRRDLENLLYLLLASMLLHGMVGLMQIVPEPLLKGWIPVAPDSKFLGMFQQPNLQASLMATAAMLALYLASVPSFSKQRWPMKVLVGLTLFISVLEVVGSGSRAGLLGMSVGLLLFLLSRWRLMVRRPLVSAMLLLAIVAGGVSGTRISDGALHAYSKVERMAEEGADVRPHIYRISFDVFRSAPLFGHGIGSFQRTFQDQRIIYETENGVTPVAPAPRFSHPHNELLFWMDEGGLVALGAILLGGLAVLLQLTSLGWQRAGIFAGMLVPIALHTQVELPFYISTLHWLVMLVILALVFFPGTQRRRLKLSRSAKQLLVGVAFIIVPLASVFLSHSLLAQTGIMQYLKGRGSQPAHLNYALNNLYFRETGEYFTMRALMYSELHAARTDNLSLFTEWADSFLEQIPDIQVFQDLAIALQQLGRNDEALAVIERAHAIYPGQKQVAEVRTRLLAGEQLFKPSGAQSSRSVESN